jgi:outer membrane protein assembly factor BamB
MHAYTVGGEPVWSRELGEFKHIWGLGSSPVLYGDTIIQFCGPSARSFHIALDRKTGETRWETPAEPGGTDGSGARFMGSWVTPVLTNVNGQDQLISAYQTRVVSLDPKSGREIWTIGGIGSSRSDLIYASPMLTKTHGLVMGGYQGPEFGFKLDGMGDATATHRLWRNEKAPDGGTHPQRIGTGVTVGDYIFMANADDAGSFECLDVKTGERTWIERRTKDGAHWGSPVLADGKLYVTGQSGVTHVLRANPEKFESIAENDLGEPSNSTPALSNGEIFLRTFSALYCISEK